MNETKYIGLNHAFCPELLGTPYRKKEEGDELYIVSAMTTGP
jgi:hypothetical protein